MEIKFLKTNNFWFDNAIISLHEALQALNSSGDPFDDEPTTWEVRLEERQLVLVGEEEDLLAALNKAHNDIGKQYLRNTGNYGWLYKNGDFVLYERQDFQQALKSFFTGKTGKPQFGALEFSQDKRGAGQMTDEQVESFKAFKELYKEHKLADKGYLEAPPVYEFGEPFDSSYEKSGKHLCVFSGELVKKAPLVTGMNYPFLTGASGEINFSSNLTASYRLSGKMDFLSLFAFNGLYYHLNDSDSGHFFMIADGSLRKLYTFRKTLSKTLSSKENWRHNFNNQIIGTTYSQEALLGFLISMYSQLADAKHELLEEVLTKAIYSFTKDKGIFKDVQVFTAVYKLFHFFGESNFNQFTTIFKLFAEKRGSDYETIHRNRLASDMLQFRSINGTVEQFLGTVKLAEQRGIPYLNDFIESYNLKFLPNMDADKIKLCKDIGRTIGYYSADSKNRRLLYGLRNARNRNDFLKVLSEAQFKIADHHKERNSAQDEGAEGDKKFTNSRLYISPDFFDHLPEDRGWEEYKSLVSIFAMNYYLTVASPKSEKNEQ